jgi:dephospho-CoA kinase
VERWKQENLGCGVVVIPLLFETAAERLFDTVVCTACSSESQRERLLKRGWSEEESAQRIRAQWPVERKMSQSRFVVWTEGSVEVHSAQWERVLAYLGIP